MINTGIKINHPSIIGIDANTAKGNSNKPYTVSGSALRRKACKLIFKAGQGATLSKIGRAHV